MRQQIFGAAIRVSVLTTLLFATAVYAGQFEVNSGNEFRTLRSQLQATQFLARATFAFTESDVDVLAERIRNIGHRGALIEWIDTQAAVPASTHEPHVLSMLTADGYTDPYADRPAGASNRTDYVDFAWWQRSLNAPDQLRQRMAFALMQIVVINRNVNVFRDNRIDSAGLPRYTGIVDYYDTLLQQSFGNYRDILVDVTYHPVMGIFLTHKDNVKPSSDGLLLPDENYAREILQLFSIGEHRLDPSGVQVEDRAGNLLQNYTNDDIKSLARVFTGLQYAVGNGNDSVNLHDPMEIRNFNNHDFDEKVFPNLRFTLSARTPSVENANAEIVEVVEKIFSHPNVGPFIARRLIQRLVKANPSKRYIRDVAAAFNDNGQGERGDLLAVVKAILTHNEALRSQRYVRLRAPDRQVIGLLVNSKGTEHSKLVEPIVRYAQFIKICNAQPVDAGKGFRIRPDSRDLAQLPYQAPSVFNYFRPEYFPPGYQNYRPSRRIPNGVLHSPEAQIYTPVFANRYQTLLYRHLHNNYSTGFNSFTLFGSLDTEEAMATTGMANDDFMPLLERLDLLLCHGSLSESSKATINSSLVIGHQAGNNNASELARLAIFGVLGTPEAAIDE